MLSQITYNVNYSNVKSDIRDGLVKNNDLTGYVKTTADQSIAGIKTFSSVPKTSGTPSADNDVVTIGYLNSQYITKYVHELCGTFTSTTALTVKTYLDLNDDIAKYTFISMIEYYNSKYKLHSFIPVNMLSQYREYQLGPSSNDQAIVFQYRRYDNVDQIYLSYGGRHGNVVCIYGIK